VLLERKALVTAGAAALIVAAGTFTVPAAHAEPRNELPEAAQVTDNTWTPFCRDAVYSNVYDTSLSATTQCRVQGGPALLPTNGSFRYTGPVDGQMGTASWQALQAFLRGAGYNGPIDGVPGTNTYRAIQEFASQGGYYTGPKDGVMGPSSWSGFSRALRIKFFGSE
jgi:hypothetical protein